MDKNILQNKCEVLLVNIWDMNQTFVEEFWSEETRLVHIPCDAGVNPIVYIEE